MVVDGLIDIPLEDGTYVIYNSYSKKEIYLGNNEYKVFCLLKKNKDFSSILNDNSNLFNIDELNKLILLFKKHGLLIDENNKNDNNKKIKFISYFPFLKFYKSFKIKKKLSTIISLLIAIFLIFSIKLTINFIEQKALLKECVNQFENIGTLYKVMLLFICSLIHEAGHAIAAILTRCPIAEIGLKTFIFFPVGLYTTICGLKKDDDGWNTLTVSSGGVIANLFFAGICIFLILIKQKSNLWISSILLFNLFLASVNLLIFYPFDGNHIANALWGRLDKYNLKKINKKKLIILIFLFSIISVIFYFSGMLFDSLITSILYIIINSIFFIYCLINQLEYEILSRVFSIMDFLYFGIYMYDILKKKLIPIKFMIFMFVFLLVMSLIIMFFAFFRKLIFTFIKFLKGRARWNIF